MHKYCNKIRKMLEKAYFLTEDSGARKILVSAIDRVDRKHSRHIKKMFSLKISML